MGKIKRSTIIFIILGLSVVYYIYSSFADNQRKLKEEQETQQRELVEQRRIDQIKMDYDVPSLVGKSIDQIVKILGKPSNWTDPTPLQVRNGMDEWDISFTISNNLSIAVTYNPQTRKVIDLFIPTYDSSGAADEYKSLLKLGNLKEDNPEYFVKPVVAMKDKSKYTGVIITKKS